MSKTEPLFQVYQKVSIRLPSIPNFFVLEDGTSIPIADVSNDNLLKIGEAWTRALIESAKKKKGRGMSKTDDLIEKVLTLDGKATTVPRHRS